MDGQTADARQGCTAREFGRPAYWLLVLGAPTQWKEEAPGARGSLGGAEKGLRGDAQDPQGGGGTSAPQTRSKKTAPTGAQVGGEGAGVECEYGASACRSIWCLHSLILRCWASAKIWEAGSCWGYPGRDHGEDPVYKRVNLPRVLQAEEFEQSTPPQRCPTPRQRKPQLFFLSPEAAQGWP